MEVQVIRISGIGKDILNSSNEKGRLKAAIWNAKQSIKDLKECRKWAKGHELEDAIIDGRAHSLNHIFENELLPIKPLADKYYQLHGEDYYKTIFEIENLLNL